MLHGGSGSGSENIRRSVECGVNKINVGTDYMIAQRTFIDSALRQDSEYDYPELLHHSYLAGSKVLERYIELTGSKDKALW